MRDALKAVAKTVREIISRVYPPFGTSPVVWLLVLGYPVGSDIPHLRVGVLNVLLHAKPGFLRRVLAVPHTSEFLQVSPDILVGMLASIPRFRAILATALQFGLGIIAVTHVGFLQRD